MISFNLADLWNPALVNGPSCFQTEKISNGKFKYSLFLKSQDCS